MKFWELNYIAAYAPPFWEHDTTTRTESQVREGCADLVKRVISQPKWKQYHDWCETYGHSYLDVTEWLEKMPVRNYEMLVELIKEELKKGPLKLSLNRAILDHEMPDEFCREVLKEVTLRFLVAPNETIYAMGHTAKRIDEGDKILTALEAFDLYTGQTLFCAVEYGGHKVEYLGK
jgi:hypothetical protein